MLQVLLAEDHEMVREGLKAIINAQADMNVVGEASDGQAAINLGQELRPDVVIMDISMRGMNGLKATQILKGSCPEIKILTLTRHSDTGFIQQMLRAGASGYLLKQSVSSELTRAIRAVAAGGSYLDPQITSMIMDGYARRDSRGTENQASLTDREESVLRMVAWGYSNKEISSQLDVSVKTVEAHKANSMRKLDLRGRVDIVRYALLQGWLNDN